MKDVWLEAAKALASQAADRILEHYGSSADFELKTEGTRQSPVTQADRDGDRIICEGLERRFPDIPVLSEERADSPERLGSSQVWVVDPLDGTKEFISKNGEFTVNIALVEDGEPIVGVIVVPASGQTYFAVKGGGSFREENGKTERLTASTIEQPAAMRVVRSRSHASDDLLELIARAGFADSIPAGSSVKGCLVAAGDAEAYYRFGRVMEWDVCAMQLIVEEAGGKMTDLRGAAIRYNKENPEILGFVASNGAAHARLLALAEERS